MANVANLSVMTKEDLQRMIKDLLGEELAELRLELEKQPQKQYTAPGQVLRNIIDAEAAQEKAPRSQLPAGTYFARYIRALAAGRGDPERAVKVAKQWGDDVIAKALGEATVADGGALVPPEFTQEIIELLRTRAVVRASGAQVVPMNSNSLTMPKQTAGGTASYIGENQPITPSQAQFGNLQFSAKKLAALTPVSNDLIRDSSPQADGIVRNDLVTAMSLREDLAFIRDDGTANKPKGIRYWAKASNVFAANATVNLANVTTDLAKMIRTLEEASVPMTQPGWLFTPRTKWYLMSVRDANGNLVFKPEMQGGTLFTYPYKTTNQIPNNLGVGSNESEVYLVDFSQAIIAENTQLLVDVYEGGTYFDGTTLVSGISNDQTIIRTIARHDFGLRHDEAAVVLTGVTWGAA